MYGRILVPVDGSDTSALGLDEALKIAKSQGSRLCLLHIVNEFVFDYAFTAGVYTDDLLDKLRARGREIMDQAASRARQQGVPADSVLLESIGGAAGKLICEEARKWSADLIVMGTHGRRGIRRLTLGSDAEEVMRFTTVPVLLVRAGAAPEKSSRNRTAA